jgi:molecular chaperone GrpE
MPKDDAENSEKRDAARKHEESGVQKKIDQTEAIKETGDKVEYEVIKEHEEPAAEKRGPEVPKLHGEEERSWKHKLKKKEAEIKALKKDKEEVKDKYLRTLAEMENLRKRLERERSEFQQFALSDFLREILVVLDNFERALQSRDQSDGKSFQEGVEMIYRQFLDMLKKKGVEPFETKNKKFDPMFHQAVLTEESEAVSEPEVAEELQRGYLIHGRLLRPAMVKVHIPKKREVQ